MKIYLIRHGKTIGNLHHKYIGRTDEELASDYICELSTFETEVDIIFCSPLKRCTQTANILFPNRKIVIDNNLRECDFGIFENRSAEEMVNDISYRTWVDNYCCGQIPSGDNIEEFKNRCCEAFTKIVTQNCNCDNIAIITHGGVIMSILEKFAIPKQSFYNYHIENGKYITVKTTDLVNITLQIM